MDLKDKAFDLASEEFEVVSSVDKIASGLVHTTFSVSVDGKSFVLQISDSDVERERAVRRKVKVYELASNYDVKIPELVKKLDSFTFEDEERYYYIVEKVDGSGLDQSFDKRVIGEAGRELAKIHEMESFNLSGWLKPMESAFKAFKFDEGSYIEWLKSNLNKDLQILKENGFEQISDDIQEFFEDQSLEVLSGFDPVLCHNDYSPDNILSKNGELTGVIDFDYVFSSDPRRDLVKAANSFKIEGFDAREELYRSYLEENELEGFERVEPIYRLETFVRIIASVFKLRDDIEDSEAEYFEQLLNDAYRYARNN